MMYSLNIVYGAPGKRNLCMKMEKRCNKKEISRQSDVIDQAAVSS